MFQKHLIHRTLPIGACAAAILLCTTLGRGAADRPQNACMTAYKGAQEREQSGHLREARELLMGCAKHTCGHAVAQECTAEFTRLDSSDIPSITPRVKGAPSADVQVTMDGLPLASRLDGQPLSVDPGLHEFSFSTANGLFAAEKILIAEGERNRPISISLRALDNDAQKRLLASLATPAETQTAAVQTKAAPKSSSSTKAGAQVASADGGKVAPAPSKNACMTSYKSAMDREQSGHLREARELLMACSKRTCGRSLAQQCAAKFTELDTSEIPSVAPRITDSAGAPRVDVKVTMDGELLASRLDGQPLPVDPGLHEFSFSTDGGFFAKQQVMILQGERNRPISVSLHAPQRAAAAVQKPHT
jgi:hypothetical protein